MKLNDKAGGTCFIQVREGLFWGLLRRQIGRFAFTPLYSWQGSSPRLFCRKTEVEEFLNAGAKLRWSGLPAGDVQYLAEKLVVTSAYVLGLKSLCKNLNHQHLLHSPYLTTHPTLPSLLYMAASAVRVLVIHSHFTANTPSVDKEKVIR
ncbi:hypothetical protein PAXINDRAFT_172204, partial [Paxillus involutus ATCC 200175]